MHQPTGESGEDVMLGKPAGTNFNRSFYEFAIDTPPRTMGVPSRK